MKSIKLAKYIIFLINERVRDMIYDKDENMIILSLDLGSRLALIKKK